MVMEEEISVLMYSLFCKEKVGVFLNCTGLGTTCYLVFTYMLIMNILLFLPRTRKGEEMR
jgi:hypothetical protein